MTEDMLDWLYAQISHDTDPKLARALTRIIDEYKWEAQETRAILILAEELYGDRDGWRSEWRWALS